LLTKPNDQTKQLTSGEFRELYWRVGHTCNDNVADRLRSKVIDVCW